MPCRMKTIPTVMRNRLSRYGDNLEAVVIRGVSISVSSGEFSHKKAQQAQRVFVNFVPFCGYSSGPCEHHPSIIKRGETPQTKQFIFFPARRPGFSFFD